MLTASQTTNLAVSLKNNNIRDEKSIWSGPVPGHLMGHEGHLAPLKMPLSALLEPESSSVEPVMNS